MLIHIIFLSLLTNAQIQEPVHWSFSAIKTGDKTYTVKAKTRVDNHLNIYSQYTPEGGPFPTHFSFSKNSLLNFEGNVKEVVERMTTFEQVFGVDVQYYEREVEFAQVVKLKANAKTNISGTIEYMVCNDKECLSTKTIPFSITIQ